MGTEFNTIVKDNIATAAVLAATCIAIFGAFAEGMDARADHRAAQPPVQQMETITVTASRDARALVALN